MLRTCRIAVAALFVALTVPAIEAQEVEGVRFGGYGTLGYVQDDRKDIVGIRDVSQRPDSDRGRASWQRDSRLGIQGEYHGPVIDLVGQVVFRNQVSADAAHAVELAYAAIKPTPLLDVRVGRVGYDAFLMSDIRNVGYAYPWVRPFTEYYGWIPLFSVDGADIAYVIPQGEARWRFKAQAGHSGSGIPIGDGQLDFKTDNLVSLTASRRSGPWETKLGYSTFTSRNEVTPESAGGGLAALQQGMADIALVTATLAPEISREAADLRRQLSFKDARIRYLTFGTAYDDGQWLIQAELARTTSSHKIVPHGTMGYAAVGYRTGDWMPFVAVSASRPGNSLRSASADWSIIGQSATQATAITVLNSTRMDQTTLSLGTRWDFQKRAALKLQWDATRIAPHGYGLLFKDPVLETRSSRMNQLSITLDFVF